MGTPKNQGTASRSTRSGRKQASISYAASSYVTASARPLHVLAFLLPLILLYEIGSHSYLGAASSGATGIENIKAHSLILGAFQDMGAFGRYVPAALIVIVLLAWHMFLRDPWRVHPTYLAAMAAESLLWTVPLLVLVALVQLAIGGPAPAAQGAPATTSQLILSLPREGRIVISIGAGLYEEFLFRMVGIAALHAILVDVVRLKERGGTLLAVLIAAIGFSIYHDITAPSGAILTGKAISLLVAGVYFGVIYVLRGFGVVVAVHALYDIFVLVLLRKA
jgi:hypothetical protein